MKRLLYIISGTLLTVLLVNLFLFGLFTLKINHKLLINKLDPKIPLTRSILEKGLQEIGKNKKYNLLFIGSSHCYRGFDPEIFKEHGYTSFNLGSSSQTPLNTYQLLKEHIQYSDTIILETYPVVFSNSGTESYYDFLASTNNPSVLTGNALALKEAKPLSLLFYKPYINHQLSKNKLGKCVYHNGYVQVTDSAKNKKIPYDTQTLKTDIMEKQFGYLRKIAKLCMQNNKKLILVYAPIPAKAKLINEDIYNRLMTEVVEKYNLTYFNLGRNHQLNDGNHFYDDDHLNAAGVRLFNERLISMIKQR